MVPKGKLMGKSEELATKFRKYFASASSNKEGNDTELFVYLIFIGCDCVLNKKC